MFSNNTIGAQSECDIIYVDYVYNGVPGRYFFVLFHILEYFRCTRVALVS